jgi:hypothetical protein
MEYDSLCDVCVRRYEGCYLYEFFIKPLESDGVIANVASCVHYKDEVESDDGEL